MKEKTKTIALIVIFTAMLTAMLILSYISATTDYETTQTVEFRTRSFFITTPTMLIGLCSAAAILFVKSDEDKEKEAKKCVK